MPALHDAGQEIVRGFVPIVLAGYRAIRPPAESTPRQGQESRGRDEKRGQHVRSYTHVVAVRGVLQLLRWFLFLAAEKMRAGKNKSERKKTKYKIQMIEIQQQKGKEGMGEAISYLSVTFFSRSPPPNSV